MKEGWGGAAFFQIWPVLGSPSAARVEAAAAAKDKKRGREKKREGKKEIGKREREGDDCWFSGEETGGGEAVRWWLPGQFIFRRKIRIKY